MKYLIPHILSVFVLFSCSNDETETSAFQMDDYVTFEGSVITDTTNAATINAWYTATYLPKMLEYTGIEGAYLFQALTVIPITASSVDFISGNLAMYKSSDRNTLMGLPSSAQSVAANTAMTTQYPNGEIVRSWSVSYEKVKSWENPGADQSMQFVTMVPTVAAAGYEDTVNSWEVNTHVPDHMESSNLTRVVRYKKISGTETGADAAGMAEYIELFYYKDQACFDAHSAENDPVFAAAEADRVATWQNDELTFPFIYMGAVTADNKK